MMYKAAVIIPCFNVEDYIQECLDSVILQGEAVQRTFVVDNNCTDSTVLKVKEWHRAHPTFALTISEEKKTGAPAARNNPLSQIETKWIQFLDADDLLLPGKITDQINRFPNADVICSGAQHLSILGTKNMSFPNPQMPLALLQGNAGITSANLFSTRGIQSIGGWGETLKSSQEYDLMFRLWKSEASFAIDPKPRAIIRERKSGQISQSNAKERWLELVHLRELMLSYFLDHASIDDSMKIEFYQAFFDKLRSLAKLDLDAALNLYDRILGPVKFSPKQNDINSAVYVLLFRILGFYGTERMKRLLF